jgi:hypothetical protein
MTRIDDLWPAKTSDAATRLGGRADWLFETQCAVAFRLPQEAEHACGLSTARGRLSRSRAPSSRHGAISGKDRCSLGRTLTSDAGSRLVDLPHAASRADLA